MRVGNSSNLLYLNQLQQKNKAGTAEKHDRMDSFVLDEMEKQQSEDFWAKAQEMSIEDVMLAMNASSPMTVDHLKEEAPASFDRFSKDMGLKEIGFKGKELEALKKQYDELIKLEKDGKFKEAGKVWASVIDKINKKQDAYELDTFKKDMKELGFSGKEIDTMSKTYEKIIKLEKEGKTEEADKLWKTMDDKIQEKQSN